MLAYSISRSRTTAVTSRRSYARIGSALACAVVGLIVWEMLPKRNMQEAQQYVAKEPMPLQTVWLSDVLGVGLALTVQAAAVIQQVKEGHTEGAKIKGLTQEGVDEPVTLADELSNAIVSTACSASSLCPLCQQR